MRNSFLTISVMVFAILYFSGSLEKIYYDGPKSSHFDGKKFYNVEKTKFHKTKVFNWMMFSKKPDWPEWVDSKPGTKPKNTVENLRITSINHSSFLIQSSKINIVTDPIWSDRLGPFSSGHKRVTNPGIVMDDLPNIDIVLISHAHYDHLDIPSLKTINEKFHPQIIAPLGVCNGYINDSIENVRCKEIDWWNEIEINGTKIVLTPAQHWSMRGAFDRDSALWGGYMILTDDQTVYFAGDTGFGTGKIFNEIKKLFPQIDVAILPIGSYLPHKIMSQFHLSPEDAVNVYKILKPSIAIAMHYNVFNLAGDQYNEAADTLKQIVGKEKLDKKFILLPFGQYIEN